MISVDGLKVEFGVEPLFSGVSFVVNDRDRIALVGKNGAGKSTMLKILCGLQKPTDGNVAVPTDTTIGYLPQVMKLQDDTTVAEEARKAFADISKMETKVKRLEQELSERTDYESEDYMQLVEKFTQEHERFMMMGAENSEAEMERTLTGLGFVRGDFNRPTSKFSGGWRMRIELAKILLRHPDVLLLDEPTNHLDIESIQWLEQFLIQSAKAVVLVSHDRAFINNVTNRTLEISCHHVVDYKVKYDEYVKLRAERREQQLRASENQQKEIADTKAFIERFRYQATKAVQVQQRIRQLEKIVPIEVDEVDTSSLRLKFPPCLRSGDYPIICEDATWRYCLTPSPSPKGEGSDTNLGSAVFSDVNFTIKRGEKVAFVGRNGEGKSTMVKLIMQTYGLSSLGGVGGGVKVGHNIQIGYFAQNQAQLLDEDLTVFQTIDNVATGEIRLKIRDILGAFMFGGEASDKKVKVLSGGERSRLAMIRLLLEPVNLLILDEPTNHLDMQSKDVLKEAIKAFDGTAILVSHDREFLDGLVSKVYEFKDHKVREYLGGIYEWIQKTHNSLTPNPSPKGEGNKVGLSKETTTPLASRRGAGGEASRREVRGGASYQERREIQKRINRLEKQIKESEAVIENLDTRLHELDTILMEPENGANMALVNEYTEVKEKLDAEELHWMEISEQLAEMKE